METKTSTYLFQNTTDFPIRVTVMEDQNPTELHTHEGVELVCIYAGEGIHLTEYGNMPLKSGDIFVIPRGFAHGYEVKKKLSLFNLLFIPERLPMPQLDLCQLTGFQQLFMPSQTRKNCPFFHIGPEELASVVFSLRELLTESENIAPAYRTYRLGLLMVLLCKLTRLYSVSGKEDEHLQEGINKVLEYLNIHFREKIKVDSLSKSSRMSRSNFLRVFKLMTGVSPLQYVLHLRINYACRELQETRRGITEIAYDSGFEDSNYFSRTFRKFIGMTPREYRLRNSLFTIRKTREHDLPSAAAQADSQSNAAIPQR